MGFEKKVERVYDVQLWDRTPIVQAACRSPIAGGIQGPALGPLVGSRGNTPVGVQGAEAPGFQKFSNPNKPVSGGCFTYNH